MYLPAKSPSAEHTATLQLRKRQSHNHADGCFKAFSKVKGLFGQQHSEH